MISVSENKGTLMITCQIISFEVRGRCSVVIELTSPAELVMQMHPTLGEGCAFGSCVTKGRGKQDAEKQISIFKRLLVVP